MSEIILRSESLNKVLDGKKINQDEIMEIFHKSIRNPQELFLTANRLRHQKKKRYVTFSKKAFFNIINLCRDVCSYCTYKAEPWEDKISMMSKSQVYSLLDLSRKNNCIEALLVTGESPEAKYPESKQWLKENGFSSLPEYLIHISEVAVSKGLFPHTNAGNLDKQSMQELKKTNISMGLMLENSSPRMTRKGMPHYLAPSKNPAERIKVLENAGELRIPMTTGLLVGIGETDKELVESILEIKRINEKFGNIQEVIIQNFNPKLDTLMKSHPPTEQDYFKRIVALTRIIMPDSNIQIPPNLSPESYYEFLHVGVNDWGGISPLTIDHVNPEFSWPKITDIKKKSQENGYQLKCRFPTYPEFFEMVSPNMLEKIKEKEDSEGYVKEEYWR